MNEYEDETRRSMWWIPFAVGGGVILLGLLLKLREHLAGNLALLALLTAAFTLYFLPTLVARTRRKSNTRAIFVLNLLAGWTFVGWVVAMVWAMTVERAPAIVA